LKTKVLCNLINKTYSAALSALSNTVEAAVAEWQYSLLRTEETSLFICGFGLDRLILPNLILELSGSLSLPFLFC